MFNPNLVWLKVETNPLNYNLAVSEERLNKDNVLLVGENSYVSQTNSVCLPDPHPFSAFLHLAVLTHGVTARRRAECRTPCGVFRLTATRALPSTRKGDASPLTPDLGLQ